MALMDAIVVSAFGRVAQLSQIPQPSCGPDEVVVRVGATGLCLSDWHGWAGHDSGISVPYVPGHEFAGEISAVGAEVRGWSVGDRVTAPFVCACGTCSACRRGDHQVCLDQEQPGFTYDGSFAEFVVVKHAEVNLVGIPEQIDFATAAILGCRFATSYRAVVDQGQVQDGQTVVVHGCGGVGLSAVMIAASLGARVVAVDISAPALARARQFGATEVIDASQHGVGPAVMELTADGADVSIDAFGHGDLITNSLACLRPGGRHVQIGLVAKSLLSSELIATIIAKEITFVGSHGLSAADYPALLAAVARGDLHPELLIQDRISLSDAADRLARMGSGVGTGGVTVILP